MTDSQITFLVWDLKRTAGLILLVSFIQFLCALFSSYRIEETLKRIEAKLDKEREGK